MLGKDKLKFTTYQTRSDKNSVLCLISCIEFLKKKRERIKLGTETSKLTDGQAHGQTPSCHVCFSSSILLHWSIHLFSTIVITQRTIRNQLWRKANLNLYPVITFIPYHNYCNTSTLPPAVIRGVTSTIDRKLYSHILVNTIFFVKLSCSQERWAWR